MTSNFFIAFLITCLSFLSFSAEGYYYKKYTTSNSLIANNVFHSIRDHKGYMWFFTDKGVSKFDGAKFTNFSVVNGLSENESYSGYQDKSGRLWLFTKNGLPCFIRNDSGFNERNNAVLTKMPKIGYIEHIYEDSDSSLYIGYTDGSVYKLHDTNCKQILNINYKNKVSCICKEDNIIKVYGEQYVFSFHNDHVIDSIKLDKNISFHDFAERIFTDKEGIKIFRGNQLIWGYKDSLVDVNHHVIHLYYDGEENVFCATTSGLIIINTKTNRKDKLFAQEHVSCTSQDIYGNYWITTKNGIYHLNKNLNKIRSLDEIADYNATEVSNQQLFFSKNNTIYYYKNNITSVLEKIDMQFKDDYQPAYADERYFFYSHNNTGYCLDRQTKKVMRVPNFKKIYKTTENKYIDLRWSDYMILTLNGQVSVSVPDNTVTGGRACFFNNTLYFYNTEKVFSYNIDAQSLNTIDVLNAGQSVASGYFLDHTFMVVTNDQSIITYDPNDGNRKQVIKNLPFSCYDISLLESAKGGQKYIMNTSLGYFTADNLNDLSRAKKIESPINQADLLNLYAADSNVICNINGSFYIFNESLINKEIEKPIFYIERVSVDGKARNDSVIQIKNSFRTHVSVTLSSLKFNNVTNHYVYRIITSNNTSAWYNSASDKLDILLDKYDDYKIEIRAVTENNLATESRFINITVLPPFYLSLRFFALVIVLLILATILGIRAYHKHRLKLFQNELNYLQLEHKAINSLLNPHFIFNAINNIQGLINTNSTDTANNYLAILSRLIRQNIDNLQFSFIPVSKELSLIKNYIHLQNLRFDNRIQLEVDNSIDDLDKINVPPLLIHTFVENSVVHGFRKDMDDFTITVELNLSTDDYLIIRITDNGTGLSRSKASEPVTDKLSLGIEFIRKRLKRISDFYKVNYSLGINDVPGKEQTGTEVVIVLYSRFKNET